MLYDFFWIHHCMLTDLIRCEAFRRAILAAVRPGDVVLDFGAGTGLLSLFAVQAGARKVYAVERAEIADIAERVIARNGAADRIEVIRGDIAKVEIPEPVDVIVSEWLGGYGVDENMFAPLLAARDRWLKPGGRMVPQTVTAVLSPVYAPELDAAITFLRGRPYDLDLDLVADGNVEEVRYGSHYILPEHLLAPAQRMWTTDSLTCSLERARSPFTASLRFSTARAGGCNALAAWFTSELAPGITLTNAPEAPATHWGRTVFPLSRRIDVAPGTGIAVEFTFVPDHPDERSRYGGWSVSVDGGAWEHHGSHLESGPQIIARNTATMLPDADQA